MMKKKIISLMLCACLSLVGCSGQTDNIPQESSKIETSVDDTNDEVTDSIVEDESSDETVETETVEELALDEYILSFAEKFNNSSTDSLDFVEDFVPNDKLGGHYRTEFRLGAYSDAIGKAYSYKDAMVDIIARKEYSGDVVLRVYMDNASLEQCIDVVRIGSPILDSEITSEEIQETTDYITENKTANGYYYANLSILLLGNDNSGYELMLKMGND